MEYREIYQNTLNIKIPKNFDIHHLDFNKENNSIENLLMLPNHVHNRYHSILRFIRDQEIDIHISSINMSGNDANELLYHNFSDFIKIQRECNKWMDFKQYLLNNLPNIHNINLDN